MRVAVGWILNDPHYQLKRLSHQHRYRPKMKEVFLYKRKSSSVLIKLELNDSNVTELLYSINLRMRGSVSAVITVAVLITVP